MKISCYNYYYCNRRHCRLHTVTFATILFLATTTTTTSNFKVALAWTTPVLRHYTSTARSKPAAVTTTISKHLSTRTLDRYNFCKTTSFVNIKRNMSANPSINAEITNPEKLVHAPDALMPEWMMPERTRVLTPDCTEIDTQDKDCVVYWMQRDVRTKDNWALLWSSWLAKEHDLPLRVIYTLHPPPMEPYKPPKNNPNLPPTWKQMPLSKRYGDFLLGGLELVYDDLSKNHHIPLHVLQSPDQTKVGETVLDFVKEYKPAIVVTDFHPVRVFREWVEAQFLPLITKDKKNAQHKIPLIQVDAHNVVPVWVASTKREMAARTLRTKIQKQYDKYLQDYEKVVSNKKGAIKSSDMPKYERKKYEKYLEWDESIPPVTWCKPGYDEGMKQFKKFVEIGLPKFASQRNDPSKPDACSHLSVWINHGQISCQRIALELKHFNKHGESKASFIEEAVIRRELSDNYVYYAPNEYDTLDAAADWARDTLNKHESDPRVYLYSLKELEFGETYDELWNAAQLQVMREGSVHGYMRMYWAKKVLEWTENPEIALATAQYLNDKYALDGRDPNGFVGVGWSVMGIHDQGWKERDIFGKIRYMNYNGCKRKFDVEKYVAMYDGALENAKKAQEKGNEGSNEKKLSGDKGSGKKKSSDNKDGSDKKTSNDNKDESNKKKSSDNKESSSRKSSSGDKESSSKKRSSSDKESSKGKKQKAQ